MSQVAAPLEVWVQEEQRLPQPDASETEAQVPFELKWTLLAGHEVQADRAFWLQVRQLASQVTQAPLLRKKPSKHEVQVVRLAVQVRQVA